METTAIAGQINLLPFQIGAVSLNGAQTQEGADPGYSPFMAILQKIVQGNGGQAGPGQTLDNQVVLPTLEGVPVDSLLSQAAAVSLNGAQTQEGADPGYSPFMAILQKIVQGNGGQAGPGHAQTQQGADAGQNPIIAILQKVQQANDGQTTPNELVDQFLRIMGMIGGQKIGGEYIQESDKSALGTSETEDVQKKSIEPAIILALTRLLQPKGTVVSDKAENKPEGEDVVSDDLPEQDESVEAIAAEILSALFLSEGSATTQGMRALSRPGMDSTGQDGDSDNVLVVESREGQNGSPGLLLAGSIAPTVTGSFSEGKPDELDANEEIPRPADNANPSRSITEPAAPLISVVGALSVPLSNICPDVYSSEQPEGKSVPQQGKVIEVDSSSKKPLNTDQAVPTGMPLKNEETIGTTGHGAFDDTHRAVVNAVEQNAGKSSNDEAVDQNVSRNRQGEGNDFVHHAKVLYSRFQTATDGTQQAVPNAEQMAPQDSQTIVTKVTDKIESLLGKVEPEVVKVDASSKSHSFSKGEGDSHQLGQGLGDHGVMQKAPTETGDVSPFGSIVADRIARMTEHVAQTNRSDLTLRLKIDGSESVLLQMKERAGVITIGIQCQDKGLVQALENQKETMVRNLETKNLNTSISITSIGEDEQDGQRHWQKERQNQRRDNWNGRQMSSSSYFETLI